MVGAVEVVVDSTLAVELGGDFDNRSVVPHLFDWTAGKLTLNGTMPRTFEVAGINLGQTSDGFLTDVDAIFDSCQHTNYSMGTVEVASTAKVTFANRFANTAAVGCAEALYVHNLIFQSGATVAVDNCKVYYDTLTDNGVTPTLIGCGELVTVTPPNAIVWDPTKSCASGVNINKPCAVDADCPPGTVGICVAWPNANPLATSRSLRFTVTGPAGPSKPEAIKVTMVDLQHPNPANLPAQAPSNFTTYDTRLNGVCNVGTLVGHHCDVNTDCPSSTCGSLAACTVVGEANICARWVGKPGIFLEYQDLGVGGGTYIAARLQCTPYYHDWKPLGLITVVGAEIVPSSEYSVQTYGASCLGNEATCEAVSTAVTMYTRRSGDTGPSFNPPSSSGEPSALDIALVVNKLKTLPGALVKAITQLQPNVPELNADINALDIVAVVDAVKGMKYGFSGPCVCPSAATCGALACSVPTTCTGSALPGLGAGAQCVQTCVGGANIGDPCINNGHCPGGTCGAGFCRDRCGRCTP